MADVKRIDVFSCFLISKDPLHCYVEHAVKPLANIRFINLHSCDQNISVLSFDDDARSACVRTSTANNFSTMQSCGFTVLSCLLLCRWLAVVAVLAVAAVTAGSAGE